MYQLQYTDRHASGSTPFGMFNMRDHYVPTRSEAMMFKIVSNALQAGLTFSASILGSVKRDLADELTPEIINEGTKRVEGGNLGMDAYYCRQAVERTLTTLANQEALAKLQSSGLISIGKKIKNMTFGSVRYSTSQVTAINEKEGSITFLATRRGSPHRWEFTIGANKTSLLQSLTDAVKCKDVIDHGTHDGVRSLTVTLGKNRNAELNCQI
jgi:hypothetical protein